MFVNMTMSESVLSRESDDIMISADLFKIASLAIWTADKRRATVNAVESRIESIRCLVDDRTRDTATSVLWRS